MDIAKQIVRTSLAINDRDIVHISASPHTLELAMRVAQEIERVGSELLFTMWSDDLFRTRMRDVADEYLSREPRLEKRLAEVVTAEVDLSYIADPKVFTRASPAKMSLGAEHREAISKRKRERGVRSVSVDLGLVTPQRARQYGVSYAKAKRAVDAALGANMTATRKKGHLIAKYLDGAPSVHLRGPDTDLTMKLTSRSAFVEDGIVDSADIQRGFPHTWLPAGELMIAPLEDSVNGRVTFDPFPLLGKWIRGATWEFRDGRLVSFSAGENERLFRQHYDAFEGVKDRLAGFTVGLNPRAQYVAPFVADIVQGVVGFRLGGNEEIGGMNKGPRMGSKPMIRGTTLETESVELIKDGKLTV